MIATGRRARWEAPLLAVLLILTSFGGAAAWPVSPFAGGADRLDLAAMTLDLDDLPEELGYYEYQDFLYDPAWIAAGYAGTPTTREEVLATGLRRHYESSYRSPDGQRWIRSYVLEFGSPEQATRGFAFFEDEARWAAAFASDSEIVDLAEDPGIGEQPREISAGLYDFQDCCDVQTVDVTFRVGSLLAGVAIEAADFAEAPDRGLALDLARTLAQRVRSVLDGEPPAGIATEVPNLLLPTAGIWPATGIVAEGHLTLDEGLGIQKPLIGFREDYQGGYARTVWPDTLEGSPGIRPIFVTVAVLKLDNPLMAEIVLKLNEFLPRPAPLPLYVWSPTEAPEMAGTRATAALAGPRWADAYQIGFVVDRYLVRVWVEGTDDSQAIALDLATQQATCLATGEACDDIVVPAALTAMAEPA